MKKTYICNSEVRAWIDNNMDSDNYADIAEGVVMDSFIGYTKSGLLVVALDTYETAWTSGLTIYKGSDKELWNLWEKFTADNADA